MEVRLAVRTDLYRTVRSVIRLVSRSYVWAIARARARTRARTCNRYRLVLITRLEVWL